ncbi:MAG: hypothetical protein HQL39_05450 [Alphaproteobacteria bacterium]|nr:hypothetical protein [Alphaproteobacteria bacterium]
MLLSYEPDKWSLSLAVNTWLVVGAAAILAALLAWRWCSGSPLGKEFELDQAEFGIGQNKIRFKPNLTARQTAYAIWVELRVCPRSSL